MFGTFINMGLWIATPMGFIYDKFGPKFSCLLGIAFLSGSYAMLHFIMNSEIFEDISIYPLLVLAIIMGQGSALCYTTSVTTNLKNFRFKDSSSIVGLLVFNMAISPSIFTTFRENIKMLTTKNFFYILSIFLSVIIFVCALIFENIEKVYSDEKIRRAYEKFKERKIVRVLIYFNFVTLFVYLFGVVYNYYVEAYVFPLILIYPCLQLLNFVVVLIEKLQIFDKFYYPEFKRKLIGKSGKSEQEMVEVQNDSIVINNMFRDNSGNLQINKMLSTKNLNFVNQEHLTFFEAIQSKNLLILFIMLILGIGSVISNLNNIHYVLKALNVKKHINTENNLVIYHDKELFFYVILYFAFNSTTRLYSGLIIDYFIHRKKFFYYIFFFSCIGCLSQIFGSLMNKTCLYISISLAGATHGGYMTFTPVFARNQFGLENMGKILGFLTTGCAIGSFFVSDFIFILPYYLFGDDGTCRGALCFYPSYMITTTFFIFNILLAWILIQNFQNVKSSGEENNVERKTDHTKK